MLSIVIPVYRAAGHIETTVAAVAAAWDPDNLELILVNDGSPDDSFDRIARLARRHPWIVGVDLHRNSGQHAATLAGLKLATGDRVVTLDDDLQFLPADLPRLLAPLDQGFDVVYGVPARPAYRNPLRQLLTAVAKSVIRTAFRIDQDTPTSSFRAIRGELLEHIRDYRNYHVDLEALLHWLTARKTAVTVRHRARASGQTGYGVARLIEYTVNLITQYTIIPLRIVTFLGFLMTLFGFMVLCYVLWNYLDQDGAVAGFTFMASIVSIFSGVQLFGMGVIGEYVGRIYIRSIERPSALIRDIVRCAPPDGQSAASTRTWPSSEPPMP